MKTARSGALNSAERKLREWNQRWCMLTVSKLVTRTLLCATRGQSSYQLFLPLDGDFLRDIHMGSGTSMWSSESIFHCAGRDVNVHRGANLCQLRGSRSRPTTGGGQPRTLITVLRCKTTTSNVSWQV